jgi:phosphoglycolate phosphatase
MTRVGCEFAADSDEFEAFRQDLLRFYADNLARRTALFQGMDAVLGHLDAARQPWGIVTNKPAYLTTPLLRQLDLLDRAAVVISGDTLHEKKPHPAPLLLAAQRINTAPANCVYIGDAKRDIDAGRSAGMSTIVALYGYLAADDAPQTWGADAMVSAPPEIAAWLSFA